MFALNKYLEKLYQVKWKFDTDMKDDLEDLLFVTFKTDGEYFKLDEIKYTVVDLLVGLEELDFELCKIDTEIVLQIF